MLFRAGLPITIGYIALVLLPGWRLLFRARNSLDYAAACVIVLWTLALGGLSTYQNISFEPDSYFVLYLAGYCHARLYALKHQPALPRAPAAPWTAGAIVPHRQTVTWMRRAER
jgi:hypothetical protein